MSEEYVVNTDIKKLEVLDGYSCRSQSKDHFLRHLGYKFSKICDMYTLNNAYNCGELGINIIEKNECPKVFIENGVVLDEYWNEYGYILEIEYGENIEPRSFVNDMEAYEWINSRKIHIL